MASRPIHILAVGAHPADVFDSVGGTLAHHVARGDAVTAVIATTGAHSHHWKLIDAGNIPAERHTIDARHAAAAEEKMNEVRKACAILGFEDVRNLGFADLDAPPTRELIEALADTIRDVRPDLMLIQHPYELGGLQTHGAVAQAAIYASYRAEGTGRGAQPLHHVPLIYIMNPTVYSDFISLGYAGTAQVTHFIDISDVVEQKVRAMDQIASQYYDGAVARKTVENENGYFGMMCHVAYAEAFQQLVPAVRYTLPVTDADLAMHKDQKTRMARRSEIVAALMPLPDGRGHSSRYRMAREKYEQ